MEQYKVKSNSNPEPLGMSKTLEERLTRIGIWLFMGEIDNNNYLRCLETAFEHWGWIPPQASREPQHKEG